MNDWALALRLARREMRAGLAGFRVFLACLVLGVGAIAAVGALGQAVAEGLRNDSRRLLGGDVDLTLQHRPATADERAYLESHGLAVSGVAEMRAMAQAPAGDGTRTLVELKAVDAAYPLVGRMDLEPPIPLSEALAPDGTVWGAVADAGLLEKLGIGVGAEVEVGEARFRIRAAIAREPDKTVNIFRFGPRIMVAAAALPATGLVQPGSQIHYHYRVRLAEGANAADWMAAVDRDLPTAGWRIRGTDEAAAGVRHFIRRMAQFLSFVGLTTLLVGGIGVTGAVASYLEGKTATIATLKCLGAPGGLVLKVYFLQVLALGVAGVAGGTGLGAAAPAVATWVAPWVAGGRLPVNPVAGVYAEPLALAAVFGLLAALTFALWPLARARDVPPATLFRHLIVPAGGRPRAAAAAAIAAGFLGLVAMTFLTSPDKGFAAWFVGGAVATLLVLRLGAAAIMGASARLPRPRAAAWRLALANLHRPGSAAPQVVLSLGLGLSVLVAVAMIEGNLGRQISQRIPEEAPAFFFLDIQPDQAEAFDAAVRAVPGTRDLVRRPTLRGRIVRIAGVPVAEATIDPHVAWAVRGDRVLTYAGERPDHAKIVAGEWWAADYAGPPAISLDAGIAEGFGIGVGDTLTLNVLGRRIETVILSLREIDWRSLRFDFAIVFAPGTLEGAPQTHVAAVKAPPEAEGAIERAIADLRNVSAVRVREALEAAARILAGVGAAVRGTALLTILAGVVVLSGTIAAGRRRRVYDAVVFKVLGATRRHVLSAFVIEYGILGLATGVIAAAVGTATAWAVVVRLMGMTWTILPGVAAATVAISLGLAAIAGFGGTWWALGQKSRHIPA